MAASSKKPAKPSAKPAAKTEAKTPAKTSAQTPLSGTLVSSVVHAPRHLTKLARPTQGETCSLAAPGPNLLLGALVVMQGASAGVCQLGLAIDGELVWLLRPQQATARGLPPGNASGIAATHSSYGHVWSVVLGFGYPLAATRDISLAVQILEPVAELELTLWLGRA